MLCCPAQTLLALSCYQCNAVANENLDCWNSPNPPSAGKLLTKCSLDYCFSKIYFAPANNTLNGSKPIPISIRRDCADSMDEKLDEVRFFARRTLCKSMYTTGINCQMSCYCKDDNCNGWSSSKQAELHVTHETGSVPCKWNAPPIDELETTPAPANGQESPYLGMNLMLFALIACTRKHL